MHNRHSRLLFGLFVIFMGFFVASWPTVASAQQKSWYFPSWEVVIQVNEDATVRVRELQTFDFTGDFSFVTRTISKQRIEDIIDIRVTDAATNRVLSGRELEISDRDSEVEIKINFNASNTQKMWLFEYTVIGGIGYFDDHQEFYWNAISSDRDVRIDDISIEVRLPRDIDMNDMQHRVLPTYPGTATSRIGDARSFVYESVAPFGPYTDFTIVAGWPNGVVHHPGILHINSEPEGATIVVDGRRTKYTTPAILKGGIHIEEGSHRLSVAKFGHRSDEQTIDFRSGEVSTLDFELHQTAWYTIGVVIVKILVFLWFLSPIGVLIWLIHHWRRHGRDPQTKTGHTIIAQYDPPDNIGPAEMGTLFDERADLRDLVPSIIDLAYRGYLTIIQTKEKSMIGKAQFDFEKVKDADADLKPHEKLLLAGIFSGSKTRVSQKSLENKFYKHLPRIYEALHEEVVSLGYFAKRPDKVRNRYLAIGMVLMFVGFFGTGFYGAGVPLVIDGILVMLFSRAMPAKTHAGRLAYEHALGFKEYLYRAERYRVQNLTPELFQKFLSYAMIFGIEQQWAKQFANIDKLQPDWYQSSGASGAMHGFSAAAFAQSMSAMSTSVGSSVSTSPSSSSSGGSGFSGGGSSGGGGGGGGSSAG
jgi:uncharacterized membrane protein YgcG